MPGCGVELLIPDFNAGPEQLAEVFAARPEVLAHNIETVPRIFRRIRPGFRYERSLEVLSAGPRGRADHQVQPDPRPGRGAREISQAMADLRGAGCELLTITQYLRPSARHHPVARWVPPEEFDELGEEALSWASPGSCPVRWCARPTGPACTARARLPRRGTVPAGKRRACCAEFRADALAARILTCMVNKPAAAREEGGR